MSDTYQVCFLYDSSPSEDQQRAQKVPRRRPESGQAARQEAESIHRGGAGHEEEFAQKAQRKRQDHWRAVRGPKQDDREGRTGSC